MNRSGPHRYAVASVGSPRRRDPVPGQPPRDGRRDEVLVGDRAVEDRSDREAGGTPGRAPPPPAGAAAGVRAALSHQTSRWLSCRTSACSIASTGVTPMPADTQDDGGGRVDEDEVPPRARRLEVLAHRERRGQVAAGDTVLFPFDAEPIQVGVGGRGERVGADEGAVPPSGAGSGTDLERQGRGRPSVGARYTELTESVSGTIRATRRGAKPAQPEPGPRGWPVAASVGAVLRRAPRRTAASPGSRPRW